MQRTTFQALGLFCLSLCFSAATMAQAPPPPPPGGGSTGGGYTPGGGGGTGSASNMLGGTAVQDNLAGGSGDNCCDVKDSQVVDTVTVGKLNLSAVLCSEACPPLDRDGVCDSGCGPCAASDPGPSPVSGGCGNACGAGGPTTSASGSVSSYTVHKATRQWVPWNRPTQSSFGPGVFSGYDSKVYLYPDANAGTTAVVFDALKSQMFNLVDGLDGDTEDGVFHDLRNLTYKSLTMKDANGTTVTDLSLAHHADLLHWGGLTESFDVFDLSDDPMVTEHVARLSSATDLSGNTINIAYRDSLASGAGGFTAQELTDSPDRRWQIHQITDRRGDVFTYSYKSTQESGRWVVEKIDFQNNIDVDYSYTDGHLSTIDHPNGDVSSYTYGQDTQAQTATVVIKSAGAGPATTMHLTNDYMTLDASGQSQVVNQPQGIFRMAVSSGAQVLSMMVPDSNQAGVYDVYHGTGSASNIVLGVSESYYADGWTPTLAEDSASATITTNGVTEVTYAEADPATTIEDYYQGTPPGMTDETGRVLSFEYDTDGFLTKKTFDADSSYEEYAYNSFKQTTRLRDRQGNVTAFEYDANGNMTKQKTGLKEVGGQDVAQPEYAETEWAYFPVGHVNAGLLKTAYDAEWDGSSTDLHRTDYEYNARGLMTKMLESASVTGGDRPETLWTYDADDRVATTVDPGGHQSDDTYNDRGQLIEKEYDDASTEQTLYGALGTPEEGLVVKTKDRRNVVTSYTYDSAGRTTQVTVGTAWDPDILDGNADDTPITDRNEQSITTYVYLDGTELPIEVVRDGSKTEHVYDYRQRVIETKVYPYANKIMSRKVVYIDNKKFSDEDFYGRKKYYGYRASDGQMIRYVTGAYPSFSLADQTAVLNLVRDTNLNPAYTIKDAITDENGRPETVIDERGTQFLTEYNAAGDVIRETKAVGTPVEAITEMDYDEDGNVIEIRSPRYFDSTDTNGFQKCKTVMTYDGQGRVLTRTEAPGTPEAATESYAYDSDGRQVTRTDARGKIWTTTYASCCGHSVSSKNPLGHGSISNKDNGGLVTHTAGIGDVDTHTTLLDPIDAKTLRETTTRYDALGRSIANCTWLVPQGIIDPENPPIAGFDGISGQDGLTSQTLYDADLIDGIGLDSTAGVTVTNPLGGNFTVSLSAALTKMAEPTALGGANINFNADAAGSAVVSLNAENEVSFSISDAQGRTVISGIQHPHDPLTGNTHGDLLTWSCRVRDSLTQLDNGETALSYIHVDALGHTSVYTLNGLGQSLEFTDKLGLVSVSEYDPCGNVVVRRDHSGNGNDVVYDSLRRRTSNTDTSGGSTHSSYDKEGNLRGFTHSSGQESTYTRDSRGRLVSHDGSLGQEDYEYEDGYRVSKVTGATGVQSNLSYNGAGSLTDWSLPGYQFSVTRDPLGRELEKTFPSNSRVLTTRDLAGRVVGITYLDSMGQTDRLLTYEYDRVGRPSSGVSSEGISTVRVYDRAGRKFSETYSIDGTTYSTTQSFDKNSDVEKITLPDSSEFGFGRSPDGTLQSISSGTAEVYTHSSTGGNHLEKILSHQLTWSFDNHQRLQSLRVAGTSKLDLDFAFTPQGLLTAVDYANTFSDFSRTLSYATSGRVIGQSVGSTALDWSYAAGPNPAGFEIGGQQENIAYGPTGAPSAIGGQALTIGSSGHLSAVGNSLQATWKPGTKLLATVQKNNTTREFVYGPFDRPVKVITTNATSSETRHLVWENNQVVWISDEGADIGIIYGKSGAPAIRTIDGAMQSMVHNGFGGNHALIGDIGLDNCFSMSNLGTITVLDSSGVACSSALDFGEINLAGALTDPISGFGYNGEEWVQSKFGLATSVSQTPVTQDVGTGLLSLRTGYLVQIDEPKPLGCRVTSAISAVDQTSNLRLKDCGYPAGNTFSLPASSPTLRLDCDVISSSEAKRSANLTCKGRNLNSHAAFIQRVNAEAFMEMGESDSPINCPDDTCKCCMANGFFGVEFIESFDLKGSDNQNILDYSFVKPSELMGSLCGNGHDLCCGWSQKYQTTKEIWLGCRKYHVGFVREGEVRKYGAVRCCSGMQVGDALELGNEDFGEGQITPGVPSRVRERSGAEWNFGSLTRNTFVSQKSISVSAGKCAKRATVRKYRTGYR